MSQSSGDALTGSIANTQAPLLLGKQLRRRNAARDLAGGVLVVVAVFLPWNLYFGIGIPHSNRSVLVLLLVATLLSLGAGAATRVGLGRMSDVRLDWLRLGLNVPYLLLVGAFVVFDAFATIRSGGTVHVPGGVGPGGWLGVAGALLCAQPVLTGKASDQERYRRGRRAAEAIGYGSMFGAALSTGFTLCWRIRYALTPAGGTSGFSKQSLVVIDTAMTYGVVALVTVLVASWWLHRGTTDYQLSTIALGASTLVAGIIVWFLPVGREIDAFHGIAQNTSTAGVGYEGYLAWAAGAAIFASRALMDTPPADKNLWRAAARNGLLLIAVWCLGSVVMRLTDLSAAVMLNFPFSRYDSMVLGAFDFGTAVLAIWLRVHLTTEAPSAKLISPLVGFLFTLTVSRVVLGIVLAPRFADSAGAAPNAVYGNNLAQQITSTFDVALGGLALCILAATLITGRRAPTHPAKQTRPKLYRQPE